MEIFRHLQKLDVSFFDKNPVGRLMTRVTTDVDALNELFTSGVISVFDDIFTLSGIIISLFLLNYKLALGIVAILPLLILITLMFKIKVRDSYRMVRTAIARINSFLQENITGAAVVQIFGQEDKQYRRFTRINKDHLNANLQSIFYYAIFFPLLEIISALAIALIVWYGGIQVLTGALTLGTLVAFIQYSDRFFVRFPISAKNTPFSRPPWLLQNVSSSFWTANRRWPHPMPPRRLRYRKAVLSSATSAFPIIPEK